MHRDGQAVSQAPYNEAERAKARVAVPATLLPTQVAAACRGSQAAELPKAEVPSAEAGQAVVHDVVVAAPNAEVALEHCQVVHQLVVGPLAVDLPERLQTRLVAQPLEAYLQARALALDRAWARHH